MTGFSMYQGVTDQVVMSGTPGFFSVPLVPRGSSKSGLAGPLISLDAAPGHRSKLLSLAREVRVVAIAMAASVLSRAAKRTSSTQAAGPSEGGT